MIRIPAAIALLAFLLTFGSVQGAGTGEFGSGPYALHDEICVSDDINITNPLDEIVVDIPDDLENELDKIDKVNDVVPELKGPVDNEIPANLTFKKENSGLKGLKRSSSSTLGSSPSILTTSIEIGAVKIENVIPGQAKKSGKACSTILYSLVGNPGAKILPKYPAQQPAEPSSMKVSSNQFVATTVVGIFIMAFASVITSRSSSGKSLPFLIPLYSRISRDEILENKTRGNIYHLIAQHPGMDLLSIKNSLGLSNGVLAHHIHTLEREKYLRSVRDGRYRKFFITGTKIELKNSMEKLILNEIESCPSINQSQIAKNLGLSRQALNYHIRKLVRKGVVETERIGRETHCRRRDS